VRSAVTTTPPCSDPAAATWTEADERPLSMLVRNISTRYVAVAIELLLGVAMLPFNLHHLGQEAYGLWALTASVTIHFSILDLGFGGALVNFIARYRAHRDTRALNEIASTLFFVFVAFGTLAYLVMVGLAFNLDHLFRLGPGQAETGKWILLIIGTNVAANFAFSIYGGIICGFQRYDINNVVASVSSVAVALVNVAVLLLGFGLIPLVAATTAVRLITYIIYRKNAYQVYPALRISRRHFCRGRLREVTGFSVYSAVIDWANKLNYELDELVIGVFLGPIWVAVWAVADRIISGMQRLTNQSNTVLFPVVVDSDATNKTERLQAVLIQGTRLSLATVIPIAAGLIVLAEPLVRIWVGPKMLASVTVIQILAWVLALRVGNATSTTLLKGAGRIRYLAGVNIATGLVNLALSALLIRPFGLDGVAYGTLIPVAFSSIFVLWPAACLRVGVPLAQSFRQAIWPTVWPGLVTALVLEVLRRGSPMTLTALALEAVAGGVVYVVLFGVAVGRTDRALYSAKFAELTGWRGLAAAR
jgi:O-antigen/teichoic acid export membrane protein